MSNLTLNSFRSMVSTHNYGEVRLAEDGSLAKINNHFLQRTFGIGKVAANASENHYVREAFLSALSGKVDSDTFVEIRAMLGIAQKGKLLSDAEIYDKPLSRREIKAVLDIVDGKSLKNGHVLGGAILLHNAGANGLANLLKTYNTRKGLSPEGMIRAKEWQLKVIMDCHGIELQAVAAEAERNGTSAIDAIVERVRFYLADEKLSGHGNEAAKGLKSGDYFAKFSCAKWMNLSLLGLRQDAFETIADKKIVKLDATAFAPTSLTTLYGTDDQTQAIFAEKAKCGGLSLASANGDKLFAMLCKDMISSVCNNLTRNPMKITVGGKDFDGIRKCVDSADEKTVKDANAQVIRSILSGLRWLSPSMTADQFIAAAKVMNQTVYNLPKTFGSAKHDDVHANITYAAGEVGVTLTWKCSTDASVPPMELNYLVNSRGMVQVTSLVTGA